MARSAASISVARERSTEWNWAVALPPSSRIWSVYARPSGSLTGSRATSAVSRRRYSALSSSTAYRTGWSRSGNSIAALATTQPR